MTAERHHHGLVNDSPTGLRGPTGTVPAMAFRFCLAAVGVTVIAVGQVELERQRLLVERERVSVSAMATKLQNAREREALNLINLSAPAALLEGPDPSRATTGGRASASEETPGHAVREINRL